MSGHGSFREDAPLYEEGENPMQVCIEAMNEFLAGVNMKPAEAWLFRFMKTRAAPMVLLEITCESDVLQQRQLAALLFRQRAIVYWKHMGQEDREHLKQMLLERLDAEEARMVRVALAAVVGALGKLLLPSGEWGDLMGAVEAWIDSGAASKKELALLVLSSLLETAPKTMKEWREELTRIFGACLGPEEAMEVRVQALRATTQLMAMLTIEDDGEEETKLVPPALAVVHDCLEKGEEVTATLAFSALADLTEEEQPFFVEVFGDLVHFLLDVVAEEAFMDTTRDAAGTFLERLISKNDKLLVRKGLVAEVLNRSVGVASTDCETSVDDSVASLVRSIGVGHRGAKIAGASNPGEFEPTPLNTAARIVDQVSIHCPAAVVFPIAREAAEDCLRSDGWEKHRAGLMVLATITEGCRGFVRDYMGELLDGVLPEAEHPHPRVRESAAWCLAQFGEFLNDFLLQHHERVIPTVLSLCRDGEVAVRGKGVLVLESVGDTLRSKELVPYLRDMLDVLFDLIRNEEDIGMVELSVAALGTIAVPAREEYKPYALEVCELIFPMMSNVDEDRRQLRAIAMDALGHIMAAVGREMTEEICEKGDVYGLMAQTLELEDETLMEFLFTFFSNFVSVMRDDIRDDAIGALVDAAIDTTKSTSGVVAGESSYRFGMGSEAHTAAQELGANKRHEEEKEEDDELIGSHLMLKVREGFDDVKASALQCLGSLAAHMGPSIREYLPHIEEACGDQIHSYSETIGSNAILAVMQVARYYARIEGFLIEEGEESAPRGDEPLDGETKRCIEYWSTEFLSVIATDEDCSCVGAAFDAFKTWMENIGAKALGPNLDNLVEVLCLFFHGGLACQDNDEFDEDEDGGDGEEGHAAGGGGGRRGEEEKEGDEDGEFYLEVVPAVTDVVADIIGTLCQTLGPEHYEEYGIVVEKMLRYASVSVWVPGDRLNLVGSVAEIVSALGGSLQHLASDIARLGVAALEDEHTGLRRNGAFLGGQIMEHLTEGLSDEEVAAVLDSIVKCARRTEDSDAYCVDNGVAAASRALLAQVPQATAHLTDILSVIVASLPLLRDHEEDAPVYGLLTQLLDDPPPSLVEQRELSSTCLEALLAATVPDAETAPPVLAAIHAKLKQWATTENEFVASLHASIDPAARHLYESIISDS